jgi:hypothetical protein
MTYIITNKNKSSQKEQLKILLKRIFNKDLRESPDIHVLNPKDQNSVGIEEIKEFQKAMRYKPFQEKKQVGVILESEKLTTQAQNALLKTLEERSETSIYILCVDNERNLLPTIKSRGIVIYSTSQTEKPLEEEENLSDFFKLNPLEQFNLVEEYSKDKDSCMTFINILEENFRNRLELDIKNGNIDSSQKNLAFLKTVQECREKISANCNRRLTLEAMVVQLNA